MCLIWQHNVTKSGEAVHMTSPVYQVGMHVLPFLALICMGW